MIWARCASGIAIETCPADGGSVSFVHRFGSSLNRHTHSHCCLLDGVFEPRDDGSIRFLPAVAPAPQATSRAGMSGQID